MNTHAPVKTKAPSVAQPSGRCSMPFLLQRKCACGGSSGLSGACKECESNDRILQKKPVGHQEEVPFVPPIVHEVLRSSGQPLAGATRHFMEPRFGHNFSNVRIHADQRAAEAAGSVNAHAFTVGHDVVFGSGQYQPNAQLGQRLLAHELAHVVQQGSASVSGSAGLQSGAPGDRFEQEADRVADSVVTTPDNVPRPAGTDGPIRLSRKSLALQRTATFAGAAAVRDVNPAKLIGENTIPWADLYLGQTNFVLNGKSLTKASDQTVRDAFKKPGI